MTTPVLGTRGVHRAIMLHISLAAALALSATAPAGAQSSASRPTQIVVPFPAGGSADFFARKVADKLAPMLGEAIVIENKPGGGGMIGTRAVLAAPADGHTLLVTSIGSLVVPPNLVNPIAYDPVKDVAPVVAIGRSPALLVVRPGLGIKSFPELIAYAKANPGKINFASNGTGTVSHLTIELLKRETGIEVVHVPYRGSPLAVGDLLGGHADAMFTDAMFFIEHVRAGKLVPIVAGSVERIATLPDVPTAAEAGFPKLVADNTYSLFAPARTPRERLEKLNSLIRTILTDLSIKQAFAQQNAVPAGDAIERLAALVRDEASRWVPLAKASGAKIE